MTEFIRAYAIRAVETNAAGTPIRFAASTSGVKRDGLDLNPANFLLDNFRANPVFLWAHDLWGARLPIGRVVSITIEADRLLADVEFDQEDEFARQIESKYRRGYLNAVSISWDNVKAEGGVRHELLEISGVPVPSDPQALAERELAGLAELRRSLDAAFDAADVSTPDARVWAGLASVMLALFQPDLTMEETTRRALYNLMDRAYNKVGKHPPEWCDRNYLAALTEDQRRGLFLEGEPELFGIQDEQQQEDSAPAEESEPEVSSEALERILERLKSIGGIPNDAQ